MRPIYVIALIAFCQVICVGANFTTLKFYSESFGGTGLMVGLLWVGLTMPRAVLSPMWGSLSDRWGRRPILVVGSIGSILGSLIWWQAGSYGTLLTSRVVDSLLGAQATIAFSVIADCTTPERRAAGMGMVGGLVLLGFTIGPAVGGLVSSAWGFAPLGLVMACIQSVGLLLILFALPETRPESAAVRAAASWLPEAFHVTAWRALLGAPGMAAMLVVSLVVMASYAVYNTAFPNQAVSWFTWNQRDLVPAFMILGIGGAIAQGGLVRVLVPRFGEARLVIGGGIVMIAAFLVLSLRLPAPALLAATGMLALGGGVAFPCITALLSRLTPNDRQGLLLGINQMAQGLGRGFGFLAGSAFESISLRLPWWIAVTALGTVLVLMRIAVPERHAKRRQ
ncbi:MAG: transporter, family, tetracycline resistance protein [Candidatus Sumerlaeota bacterium]|nr:transporter, family, tetracycline resistance protein [Candidatus Sumerlaeota bacterium]